MSKAMISLKNYGPVISDEKTGEEIYTKIAAMLKSSDTISVDFDGVISMTTYCAKEIFGKLFKVNKVDYQNKIKLENASDDIRFIISLGIESAIEDSRSVC